MGRKTSVGMVLIAVEIPEGLRDRLHEFCRRRGEKVSEAIRLAIRRHMDYPPPEQPSPPLPDVAQSKRPKKGKS